MFERVFPQCKPWNPLNLPLINMKLLYQMALLKIRWIWIGYSNFTAIAKIKRVDFPKRKLSVSANQMISKCVKSKYVYIRKSHDGLCTFMAFYVVISIVLASVFILGFLLWGESEIGGGGGDWVKVYIVANYTTLNYQTSCFVSHLICNDYTIFKVMCA